MEEGREKREVNAKVETRIAKPNGYEIVSRRECRVRREGVFSSDEFERKIKFIRAVSSEILCF